MKVCKAAGFLCMMVFFWFLGSACGPAKPDLPDIPKVERDQLVQNNNQFAINFFHQLRNKNKDGNVFFSPYSISTALAMTYAGAKGNTAKEMSKALQFSQEANKLHTGFEWLLKDQNYRGQLGNYQLAVANKLWPAKTLSLLKSFTEGQEKHYSAKSELLDYGQAEQARSTINKWVEDKTNNKIKNLLKPGSVSASTRLVLTNAIYFKGNWLTQFKKELTKDVDFQKADKKTVKVKMMYQQSKLAYAEQDGWHVLGLPYQGKELSMYILLPKEKGTLGKKVGELNSDKLQAWLKATTERKVEIFLPRLKMEPDTIQLKAEFNQLGMKEAFGSAADFSGMTGSKSLFIDDIHHKAFLEVNEEGSEAAAATAVVMKESAAPILPIIRADHPFVLMIRDNTTGSILFMGQVTDPS